MVVGRQNMYFEIIIKESNEHGERYILIKEEKVISHGIHTNMVTCTIRNLYHSTL